MVYALKSPHKVARRLARLEILAQLCDGGPVRTKEEKLDDAQAYVAEAMQQFHADLRAASERLHATMAAIDPDLSDLIESDNYDERLVPCFFVKYWR